jgi:hypothetical protein
MSGIKVQSGSSKDYAGVMFLKDVISAPGGSAYVTDSVNPVLYRLKPGREGKDYQLEEFPERSRPALAGRGCLTGKQTILSRAY